MFCSFNCKHDTSFITSLIIRNVDVKLYFDIFKLNYKVFTFHQNLIEIACAAIEMCIFLIRWYRWLFLTFWVTSDYTFSVR